MNEHELKQLIHNLIEHLDYCGWGDRWEREVSEDLHKRADQFAVEHPEGGKKTTDAPVAGRHAAR